MGKIAFVFPGQGAQKPGMGAELYKNSAYARRIFELADSVRPGTKLRCIDETAEGLEKTINTQPCLFATELAAAAALSEYGIKADTAAGFSLGELSAAAYSYMLEAAENETSEPQRAEEEFKKMFGLVTERAELMQAAAEKNPASMAAILKLDGTEVLRLCGKFKEVYPVNYNCPGQISVAASNDEIRAFSEEVKKAGGRAVPLKVNGGFHSPFMAEAADGFRKKLEECGLRIPKLPVYSDLTARPYGVSVSYNHGDIASENKGTEAGTAADESRTDGRYMSEMLSGQIVSPVLWEQVIRNMTEDGADTFIEVGPGNTLSGMIRRINGSVRVFNVCGTEEIKALRESLAEAAEEI